MGLTLLKTTQPVNQRDIMSRMIGLSTWRSLMITVATIGLAATSPAWGQVQGLNGTWKINLEKTTGPHAKSEILTFGVTADSEHYTVDEVETDGSLFKTEYTAKFDGKAYPNKNLVTGEITYVCLKKIDNRTEEFESRKSQNGPLTYKYRRVLSADGKTLTSSIIGGDGATFSVRVFDKQ
jgi:hypothetical protein